MSDTVEVPVADLKKMLELLPRAGSNIGTVADMIQKHIPKPPTQEYYVVYKVKFQPTESADPDEETPPMDMTHQLQCVDPRFVNYGMEQIGPLLAVRDWLLEQGVDFSVLEGH